MFGYDPYYVSSAFIGGIIGIYLFSLLFLYALLGRSGTKLQQIWVVMLTGFVAVGFSAFGAGNGDFIHNITYSPNMVQIVSYPLSALIVAFFVWLRTDDTPPPPEGPNKGGIVGRAVALVFVIPMILLGVGNIGGSIYSVAVNGPAPGQGLGVSKAELREIMTNGDLAPFWRLIDERAPTDLDYIIDRMFAAEDSFGSEEDVRRLMETQVVNYRVELATYGPALTDTQRKEIIGTTLAMLRRFENQQDLCVDLAVTGGQNLSQEQLLSAQDELNNAFVTLTQHLLDARVTAEAGARVPTPATEQDYENLWAKLVSDGMTQEQIIAMVEQDQSHPEFCSAVIKFMDGVVALDGAAGEAVRFETAQGMMVASP